MTPIISTVRSTPAAIAPERASSLHRWNVVLAGLHLAQAALMVGASFLREPLASAPVVSSYLTFDQTSRTLVGAQQSLFDLPLGPTVALFLLLSAIAHFTVAWPARGWYESHLARGQNPARWIEYAFSSSLMIVVIASLSGIREVGSLVALSGANAAMILFGWSMEVANEGRPRPQWAHFVFGSIVGLVPWLVIAIALLSAAVAPGAAPIPTFVIAIYVSLFISFNVFAVNMVLQYARVGPWRAYLHGERVYMLLSLAAKSALAWQVFAGTLRP
jgi:Heliorhodopsin